MRKIILSYVLLLCMVACSKTVLSEMESAAIDEGEKALRDIETEVEQDASELANKENEIFQNAIKSMQRKQNL